MKAMVRNSHGWTDALELKGHLQARDRRRQGAAPLLVIAVGDGWARTQDASARNRWARHAKNNPK